MSVQNMNRNTFIATKVAKARNQYKVNVNNGANAAAFAAMNENPNDPEMANVARNSYKETAIATILQTLKNSAANQNAQIYANTKNVLLSEPKNQRQTVLKIAALDDLMIEERKKLAIASTDEAAVEAAGRLFDIELLKQELDDARHRSEAPTPEQEARYTALVAGVNFNSLNTSLYKRLIANNAEKTRKNNENAAAAAAKAKENANAFAAAPMVPINMPPAPKGQMLGGPAAAPMSREEMRAARLAAMAKRTGGKRSGSKRSGSKRSGPKRSGKTRKHRTRKH